MTQHDETDGDEMKNKVRELREGRGLTQKELGERVGVSRQAINAIETGKFDPSIWLAYDLSRLFGLPIEELFMFCEGDRK
jgi:putative transcriptional regulator